MCFSLLFLLFLFSLNKNDKIRCKTRRKKPIWNNQFQSCRVLPPFCIYKRVFFFINSVLCSFEFEFVAILYAVVYSISSCSSNETTNKRTKKSRKKNQSIWNLLIKFWMQTKFLSAYSHSKSYIRDNTVAFIFSFSFNVIILFTLKLTYIFVEMLLWLRGKRKIRGNILYREF